MYFYKTNKIILLLILLILCISKSYGALINGLDTADYNCYRNIVTKFNLVVKYGSGTPNYNFCLAPNTCLNGFAKQITVSSVSEAVTGGAVVEISDFSCFTQLDIITVERLPVNPAVFYNKFSASSVNYNYVTGPIGVGITAPLPAYYGFSLLSDEIMSGTTIKLSYLNGLTSFEAYGLKLTIEVDSGLVKNKLSYLTVNSLMNLPDLSGYTDLYAVRLTFDPTYQVASLANFDNYATNQYGSIHFTFAGATPAIPFFGKNNRGVNKVIYNYPNFIKPTALIDISTTANYNEIQIFLTNLNDQFNLNGAVPLKVNASRTMVNINGGDYTVFPELDKFKQIKMTSTKLTSALPINTGEASLIDFSGNQITGTIDESYCTTELYISNNKLTGTIPSCFSCYMRGNVAFPMDARFANNLLSATISGQGCPSLAPIVTKVDNESISISGKDIGFSNSNFQVDGMTCGPQSKVIKTGKEYHCYTYGGYLKDKKYVTVKWMPLTNKEFTFPLVVSPPSPSSVIISADGNTVTIAGTFFSSYNGYVGQSVLINGQQCTIISTTFTNIICTLAAKAPTSDLQIIKITTSTESKQMLINPFSGAVNNIICASDCGTEIRGNCDLSTGSCHCLPGFAGVDCLGIACPVADCNNQGSCNIVTGTCSCFPGRLGSDCSGIQCVVPDCNGNGNCNTTSGVCQCTGMWGGKECTTEYHYVTSIEPSTTEGGQAIVTGSFGETHDGLSITIGGVDCPVTSISSTQLVCTASPGQGIKIVNITQNNLIYISKDQYKYQDTNPIINCPNDCYNSLSHGVCITSTGHCKCNSVYGSFDCSTLSNGGEIFIEDSDSDSGNEIGVLPPSTVAINESKGTTSITNQEINFEIYIRSLVEVDFNDNVIHSYQLQKNWKLTSEVATTQNTYTFDQSIQNSNCVISSKIEEIKDKSGKNYTFSGIDFTVDQGSVKFSISITNYKYENNLNTLKLELVSSSNQLELEDQDDNSCNEKQSELDTVNYNDKSNLNYIKISRNNKVLSGRFINRVVSDGKSTFLSSTVSKDGDSSIITTLNLPHFVKSAVIDPDFSVLLSTEFKSTCGKNDNVDKRKSYVIPVAVVVSVVGVASIIGGVLFYRKRKIDNALIKKLQNNANKVN